MSEWAWDLLVLAGLSGILWGVRGLWGLEVAAIVGGMILAAFGFAGGWVEAQRSIRRADVRVERFEDLEEPPA